MPELLITPKTKIGELLSVYPQLEKTLFELSPQFQKLKNPVLRRTIGRVATLQQVSLVGNISINKLVNTLRNQVGQGAYMEETNNGSLVFDKPSWFDRNAVQVTFDARPIIDKGESPLQSIFHHSKQLDEDKILEIISSFIPSPIIEKFQQQGYSHWIDKKNDTLVHTYFKKQK